ncbi:MAG: aldo/keto reductase [Abditibacteriota bacterium]|nr:aldo/keto reductase [Abditibacteriota bacterium]
MEYRVLSDGLRLPVIGLGTYKAENCADTVSRAIEYGYRMFDTAEMYRNEAEVGRGIRASGVSREEVVIVTKLSHKSYDRADEAVRGCLERLQTDYIDLMLLHWPFGNYYAAWRTLEDFRAKGVIRSVGVSNFEPAGLIDLINYNETPPSVDQIETHLWCQRKDCRRWMDKYHVAHMGYAPLGHGAKNHMLELPAVQGLARKYGVTGAQICLKFQIKEGVIVIPKTSRPERLKENIDLFGFDLTDEETELLRALDKDEPFIGTPGLPEKAEAALLW